MQRHLYCYDSVTQLGLLDNPEDKRMITARQLANLYLARLADEVIDIAEQREEKVQAGFLPAGSSWGRASQQGIAYSAPIVARTFWADIHQ